MRTQTRTGCDSSVRDQNRYGKRVWDTRRYAQLVASRRREYSCIKTILFDIAMRSSSPIAAMAVGETVGVGGGWPRRSAGGFTEVSPGPTLRHGRTCCILMYHTHSPHETAGWERARTGGRRDTDNAGTRNGVVLTLCREQGSRDAISSPHSPLRVSILCGPGFLAAQLTHQRWLPPIRIDTISLAIHCTRNQKYEGRMHTNVGGMARGEILYHLGLLPHRGMYGPDAKLSVQGHQMQDGPVLRGSIWEAWDDTRWRTARDEGCLKEGE
ncbi:hypothetical protein B0H13DRAFT_1884482 [Mycena leptocephala]|nr:hypothetical protein B0H13DRAFT_1884482 [Mycena leptocephala]